MVRFRKLGTVIAAIGMVLMALSIPALAIGQSSVTLADGYVLGRNDIIEVSIVGRDDYKAKVQVQEDGTVPLPLIGSVTAINLTTSQLRAEIRRRLISGGFYAAPDVVVLLASGVSRYVVVLGEVGSPGVIPIDREYRLSEIVARAGGLRGAGVDIVTLTPPGGTGTDFSVQAITTGKVEDPVVNPGARVFVSPAKMFYIYGQVGQPGSYAIDPGMTVRRALARAGGLTALGSEKRVKLYRGDVVQKVTLDQVLAPGDTIVVGERFF